MLKKVIDVTKKIIWMGICLCVLACGWSAKVWMDGAETESVQPPEKARFVPADADFGSYLAGLTARENQDIAAAADFYEQVYKKDPNNPNIRWDLYLLSGFSGHTDTFVRLAGEMVGMRPSYFASLVLAADSLKQGDYQKTLTLTTRQKQTSDMDKLMFPVIRAWAYAGLDQRQKAYNALDGLKKDKNFGQIYWYHRALLGIYFNTPETVDESFKRLVEGEIPTVTALQAMRLFYREQNQWNKENPLFDRYYQTVQNNPALAEILIARADDFTLNAPADGAAEAFFMVSTIAGDQEETPETGLLFNAMALMLKPDSDIYKIWGAEQFEKMKYYAEANRLYQSMHHQTDVILVKSALNFMLLGNYPAAENVLVPIGERQQNDIVLHSMLAGLYRDTNRPEQAVKEYTHVIDILIKNKETTELSQAHFSRAVVYDQMGNKAARNADLAAALTLKPDDSVILNYLGYVWLEDNQNIAEAMAYVVKAHALQPDDAHIWDSLALGYYRQGNYVKALEYAEKAADNIPYSALVQMHLGDIYAALGRQREAGYQYHKALELKADMTPALKAELARKIKALPAA